MKPIPFRLPKTAQTSFRVQVDEGQHFYDRLHYHPEWQLTAIHQGRGVFLVGNSFTAFQEGDVFLIGSNVPHLIKNDAVYYSENSPEVYAISIFFHANAFGQGFFDLPELSAVKFLLQQSQRGIQLIGKGRELFRQRITDCLHLSGISRLQHFISILADLSETKALVFLNAAAYTYSSKEEDGHRLNAVFQYSIQHLASKIELEQVANLANLSVSQFCRYFKLHTRKTYMQFLNELRVETACKLLHTEVHTIAQVSYEVGFNNLSNFNRQFKKIKGFSPSDYRKRFLVRQLD